MSCGENPGPLGRGAYILEKGSGLGEAKEARRGSLNGF